MEDLSEPALYLDPLKFDVAAGLDEDNILVASDKEFEKCLTKRGILFTTTGLRNVNYSAKSLEYYIALFTNAITRQEREHGQSEPYQVELKPLLTSMQHPCPLKITVQRLSEKTQVVFVGVFFSWRTTDILPCQDYLNMSYVFVSGSHRFLIMMNDLFQKYFDCKISPIVYTQNEIKWLLAIMTHCVDESPSNRLLFTYQTNVDSSKLDFDFSFSDLKGIWNDIHDDDESVIKCEEVPRFYAAIDEHVLESSGLNLNYFLLKRFSIPEIVTLDSDGKIDCRKIAVFGLICRFIREQRSY